MKGIWSSQVSSSSFSSSSIAGNWSNRAYVFDVYCRPCQNPERWLRTVEKAFETILDDHDTYTLIPEFWWRWPVKIGEFEKNHVSQLWMYFLFLFTLLFIYFCVCLFVSHVWQPHRDRSQQSEQLLGRRCFPNPSHPFLPSLRQYLIKGMDEHHFNEGTSAFRRNFPRLLPAPLEITPSLIAAQSSYSPRNSIYLPFAARLSSIETGKWDVLGDAFVVVLEIGMGWRLRGMRGGGWSN